MKIIVGLGNPEKKYEKTYHNLGFACVDKTAELLAVDFSKQKCRAMLAETKIGGEKVLLVKPLTYMNLSGESVREILSFYKASPQDLIVIYDDFDLPKGAVRIRKSGSAGTHNGMRNIIKEIGTENFARIRVGFKPEGDIKIPLIDLVLSKMDLSAGEVLEKSITSVANALVDFASGKTLDSIMQKYNISL